LGSVLDVGTEFVKTSSFRLLTTFMSRYSSLTGIAILWSLVSLAQQGPDTGNLQQRSNPLQRNPLFTDFTCAVRNSNAVVMEWKADYLNEGDYFIVERSRDGSQFETLSAQLIVDTLGSYRLNDNSPFNGTDFYRIKWLGKSGEFIYSKSLQVSFSADVDFKFYPNPADKLLIIRTGHIIEVDIMDAFGTIRINKQLQPGLQIINLSSLERGSYVLKMTDKESNRVVSEQLVKN
jgi:Secretion system C-terminal sorting domain